MTEYYTADELRSMGIAGALLHDVILWTPRLQREYTTNDHCAANVPLTLTRAQPERTYGSQYVGVTVWKGRRYLANWTVEGRSKRGTMRPMTPEGERWAAQDRARALGLDYIEMRDGTLVPYPQYAPEEV